MIGGAGKDTITAKGEKSVVDGGTEIDHINVNASNITVTGGKANDVIRISTEALNTVLKYASGDGSDIVYGMDANDTLSITDGTIKIHLSAAMI